MTIAKLKETVAVTETNVNSTQSGQPRRGLSKILLAGCVLLGLFAGVAGSTVLFLDRTGRDIYNRFQLIAGVTPSDAAKAFEIDTPREFLGVTAPSSDEWKVRRGLDVAPFASGFSYPVNLSFVQNPSDGPDAVLLYVTELYGAVKYVTRGGEVGTFADGLVTFSPVSSFRTSQTGLTGLTTIPDSEDLLVTVADMDHDYGLLTNRILRLVSKPGGREVESIETLLHPREFTASSHHVQQVAVGPDGKVYVAVGDGRNTTFSLDLEKFGGKILRMNLDGSPCEDNPFFKGRQSESARDYVFAYGLRNVFDFDFDPISARLYAVENGKRIDRICSIAQGGCYAWDGYNDSTRVNALYTWGPKNVGPAGFTFLRQESLGSNTTHKAYMAAVGKTQLGAKRPGKSIWEFSFDAETGLLLRAPERVVRFQGETKRTIVAMREGPDGLYFTDFFGDSTGVGDEVGRGTIWRVFPSEESMHLDIEVDEVDTVVRGRSLAATHCAQCHRIEGVGGLEGPELTSVAKTLDLRLHSKGYEASLRDLRSSQQEYFQQQRWRLDEIAETKDEERIRRWLVHHLEEPRFDNPFANMPSFMALSEADRNAIIEYLMTLK